jgi:O-antigen/teichoic acid export membrane protein
MSKQLFKDTIFYGAADAILKAISFFTFPIFANLLKVDDYGILTIVGTVAGFVGMFLNMGINNAVQRFYFDENSTRDDQKKIVTTGLITLCIWSALVTLVTIAVSYPFGNYIQKEYQVVWSFFALALLANLPAQILGFCNDTIRLHFKPTNFFILAIIKNLVSVVASIVVLYYFKAGVYGCLLLGFLAPAFFVPLALYLIKKDLIVNFDKPWAKQIVKFGYPFIFAGMAYWLFGSIDRVILAEFSNNTQIGLFSIAFKFGSIVVFINGAFSQAWSPVAIKIMAEDKLGYKRKFADIFEIYFAFVVLIAAGCCLFSKEFLIRTTPVEYWAASDASVYITIALAISATTQITALGISIEKKTSYFSKIAWLTAVVNILVNLLLVPRMGADGAGIATIVSYIFLSGSYLYITQKIHPFPLKYINNMVILFTLFLIGAITVWSNNNYHASHLIGKIIVSLILTIIFYLFYVKDRIDFKSLIKLKK